MQEVETKKEELQHIRDSKEPNDPFPTVTGTLASRRMTRKFTRDHA